MSIGKSKHKFAEELMDLELTSAQSHYHLLVIGTFNAEKENNVAEWFYGRPENEFWCFLPRMIGQPTMHPVDSDKTPNDLVCEWKSFCKHHSIIIVDIFKEVFVPLESYSDELLDKLQDDEYIPFEFEKAFIDTTFDGILFTWKGNKGNKCLARVKRKITPFLQKRSKYILHMITPSNTYNKPRIFKLKEWKKEYDKLKKAIATK
jgi:hypothetical protein